MNYSYILIALIILASCDNKGTTQLSPNESVIKERTFEFVSGTFQDLSVEQAMSIPETVYLDVRTQEEVDEGAIPNSLHIDFRKDNFKEEISKLDKSKPYVVYCRSGGRSTKASKMMLDLGFEKVANMAGGYNEYKVVME